MTPHSTNYPFPPLGLRAQCVQIVNGFTVQLLLDCGFDSFRLLTVRLKDVEGPSDEQLYESLNERNRLRELTKWLRDLLKPIMVTDAALLNDWPLRVTIYKDKPSRSATREPLGHDTYTADIWVLDPAERPHRDQHEIHVNAQIKELGLAQTLQEKT